MAVRMATLNLIKHHCNEVIELFAYFLQDTWFLNISQKLYAKGSYKNVLRYTRITQDKYDIII